MALVLVDAGDARWNLTVVDASEGDVDGSGDVVDQVMATSAGDARRRVASLEGTHRPRWIWWDHDTAVAVARLGCALAKCWDLAAVHRLLHGGWRTDPGRIWALANDLDPATMPAARPDDLFHAFDERDPDQLVQDDGHLDPEWVDGSWHGHPERSVTWAQAAIDVHRRQRGQVAAIGDRPALAASVRSESAAALLAAELEVHGLPFDTRVAESIIEGFVGPRPATPGDEQRSVERRDQLVLRHVPDGDGYDLRSPEQVKSLLRRCGIEVPDTRSWRLERLVGAHPVVQPLLDWRRAERISTTFGYRWIDEHVRSAGTVGDGARLHGSWSSSDGAAGRMTATAGLHNMPAELRPAIVAEPDHVFVRADLGQIEPRILAAVSGDEALARAAHDADMYAPVAARLGVERNIAKVAVLGAMYGQTTGIGAAALRGLEREYPTAMGFLSAADHRAQGGNDLRTHGGRLVRLSSAGDTDVATNDARSRAAARGRYGRNAMVQGAAAEFFKVWAVLVRARGASLDARIVLCLHDELLVHLPAENSGDGVNLVESCLQEAAARWSPTDGPRVRFVADTSVVVRWSDAK